MEEEVNENELEEQFYSMLHHVDGTQVNENTKQDALALVENAPRTTVRRYWRTSGDNSPNNPYQRDNTFERGNNTQQRYNNANQRGNIANQRDNIANQRDSTANQRNNSVNQRDNTANQRGNAYQKVSTPKEIPNTTNNEAKPKEEKREVPEPLPLHLSFFQSPMPQNMKNTIEIIEHDLMGNVVELQSSDEDEVIEVALPPKPTITIESSDEDELAHRTTSQSKPNIKASQEKLANDREISTSPVPSVVSSISDEFIRSDCIALNISSRRSDNHSFDFSLHGADLLGQSTPSKKKKRKKNKQATSTPTAVTPNKSTTITEECFATPKSKAKNKKQKTKSYSVTEKSIPSADVYDSDSNQSMVLNPFAVSTVSLPSADTNLPEAIKSKQTILNTSNVNHAMEKQQEGTSKNSKRNQSKAMTIVDLTQTPLLDEHTDIQENIVIGNVSGFPESEDYDDSVPQTDVTKYCSTRVPAILYENLDFDNLKGKDKVCKNQKYSLTALRAEMEKFYNDSWGGEEFNHHEIQRNMSRDKRLWAIDPKDRFTTTMNRKNRPSCNYCNRTGHRDDACSQKPHVCFMCGHTGHIEPRCPRKICVNCGSPNFMYSTICRSCVAWGRLRCAECGQPGHPASHCPDVWRRYHNTIDFTDSLHENRATKNWPDIYCSSCTRRGHHAHTCRISLPFSAMPINSPYVQLYATVYGAHNQNMQIVFSNEKAVEAALTRDPTGSSPAQFRGDSNKRQSKSPTVHDSHANKKRTLIVDTAQVQQNKSPVTTVPKKIAESKEQPEEHIVAAEPEANTVADPETSNSEKAPDFISIVTNNRDKQGQMIQDNEVSDTSDVVTSARIYITDDIIEKLKAKEGEEWLKETTEKLNVIVENTDIQTFLSLKGKLVDQEAFQAELRDWTKPKSNRESAKSDNEGDVTVESDNDQSLSSINIPRNRAQVLRKINKALDSLKEKLGDPKVLHQKLTSLQNRHEQLRKQNVINPKVLSDSRSNINGLVKKLNMVLVGQAGLAGGAKHLTELHSLHKKVINFRQKLITNDMRNEIGEHYHTIFTAAPRDDYDKLLETYYSAKNMKRKEKKEKYTWFKNKNLAANQQNQLHEKKGEHYKSVKDIRDKEAIREQLTSYYKKLESAQTEDSALQSQRFTFMKRVRACLLNLTQNKKGIWKKIKNVNVQVKTFLDNV